MGPRADRRHRLVDPGGVHLEGGGDRRLHPARHPVPRWMGRPSSHATDEGPRPLDVAFRPTSRALTGGRISPPYSGLGYTQVHGNQCTAGSGLAPTFFFEGDAELWMRRSS